MKEFDLRRQAYPGQERVIDRYAADLKSRTQQNEDRDAIIHKQTSSFPANHLNGRPYLDNVRDEEIIETYYELRDKTTLLDDGCFYPNIRKLFGTPFEREKDRREISLWNETFGQSEVVQWYREAREKPCVWWVENHIIARHSLKSCMSCGNCTSLCPAAEFFDYNPRIIMETVQQKEEKVLIELLKSETLWYCSQCGSCKPKCPRKNNPFGMISSLRQLSQIKGFHVHTVRGRQQYAGRHLWGGNLWNRACSLYFRNPDPRLHKDFGPGYEAFFFDIEDNFRNIGVCPDMEGSLSGRKVRPETLAEVRKIWHFAGALYLWDLIEQAGAEQAAVFGLDIDAYHDKINTEG